MKKTISALTALIFIISLGGCASDLPENGVHSAGDIPGKRVGVLTGSESAFYAGNIWNDTISLSEYGDEKSIAKALLQNDVECVVAGESSAEKILKQSSKLVALDEPLLDADYAIIAAPENPDLMADVNAALKTLSDNGTLKKIIGGYISGTGYTYSAASLSEKAAVLTLAVDTECPPYSYYGDGGEIMGIDVDVARAVCDVLGLGLEIKEVPSEKLISTVQGGWADFAMGRFSKDGDATEAVSYSDAYMHAKQLIIVRKK